MKIIKQKNKIEQVQDTSWMNGVASKRSALDTSIDLELSFEEDLNKKIKMSREEAIWILILEGGNDYVNEPS